MVEVADTNNDQEFSELLGFLQDAKSEVQRFAAEGVLGQTESKEFLEFCQRQPRTAAKPLLRLVEQAEARVAASFAAGETCEGHAGGEKAVRAAMLEKASARATGAAALQALVNLSVVPAVLEELVRLGAPRRCAEALRSGWLEGRSELAHWHAMLLANLSTAKAGREAMCADEQCIRFFLVAFVANPRPPPRDGYDDPLLCLGKVLGNICALPEGRRLLAGGESGAAALSTLMRELGDRGRRTDVISVLRNICLDTEFHSAVVAADPIEHLAHFLYPWDKVEPGHRANLPEQLREVLAARGAALTGDAAVRHTASVSMLGLCQTLAGREYLRAHSCRELARGWHQEETEDQTRSVLEAVLQRTQLSDDEFQVHHGIASSLEIIVSPKPTTEAVMTVPEIAVAVVPTLPVDAVRPSADANEQPNPVGSVAVGESGTKLTGLFDDVG